jgi:hypothetical protein
MIINSGDSKKQGHIAYLEINIIQVPDSDEKDVLILMEYPLLNMLEITIKGHGEDKTTAIDTFPCVIGRSRKSDIYLRNEYISGKHCVIDKLPDFSFTVTDAASTNKTILNGRDLVPQKPYPLKKGDTLNIGGYSITVL